MKKYIETYHNKYECASLNSKILWKVFVEECELNGILYKMKDIINGYKNPYENKQIRWF